VAPAARRPSSFVDADQDQALERSPRARRRPPPARLPLPSRGVRKDAEIWDAWSPQLGPSRELHAALYGKHGPPIDWSEFRGRYLAEMDEQGESIAILAARVAAGETITLLCSSACSDPERCHRTLLSGLVAGAGGG